MLQIHFLGSGSAGNATLIEWRGTRVLLDCGFAPPELSRRLSLVGVDPTSIDALLLTHEHRDHRAGLPLLSGCKGLSVYLTAPTAAALPPRKRRNGCRLVAVRPGDPITVGPLSVVPFATSHDARRPVGYTMRFPDQTRLGFATDLGQASSETVAALSGCELLALEANHDPRMLRDGPYPRILKRRIRSSRGHLSNEAAASLLGRVATPRLRHLFLLHLSQTNNDPLIARRVISAELRRLRLRPELSVVPQDEVLSYPRSGQLCLL